MTKPNKKEIKKLLNRGVEEVIVKDHLKEKLESGEKLRIKFGIDPTGSDIHLGHTVVLRKLKEFQDLGHKIILIIGDFTAQIGDPTGRDKTRPTLSEEEVKKNMENYLDQAGKVIDINKAEIKYNSKWLAKSTEDLLKITKSATVNQVLRRSDFQKRLENEENISILETLYPVLQGYDSVEVKADVELGGTDQKFNLLMGRDIQKYFDMDQQDILTVPLIEGTDGTKKMSKSYDNYISLNDNPTDMFGKIMSIPDKLIDKYFETLTDKDKESKDPYESKLNLAKEIVSMYHSSKDAEKAKKEFKNVFSEGKKPEDMKKIKVNKKEINIVDLLVNAGVDSKTQAKNLIKQGGVRIDDKKVSDFSKDIKLKKEKTLQIGKKRFYKVVSN